jgi:hypothetical protein
VSYLSAMDASDEILGWTLYSIRFLYELIHSELQTYAKNSRISSRMLGVKSKIRCCYIPFDPILIDCAESYPVRLIRNRGEKEYMSSCFLILSPLRFPKIEQTQEKAKNRIDDLKQGKMVKW